LPSGTFGTTFPQTTCGTNAQSTYFGCYPLNYQELTNAQVKAASAGDLNYIETNGFMDTFMTFNSSRWIPQGSLPPPVGKAPEAGTAANYFNSPWGYQPFGA
jgi:hypothetical protein